MKKASDRPKLVLPAELQKELEQQRSGLSREVTAWLEREARPCALLRSRRVSPHPLRRSALARWFGGAVAAPTLPPMASKFGGAPYGEADDAWEGWRFLGQIDLGQAAAVLPELTARGLVRLDMGPSSFDHGIRARWFPDPSPVKLRVPDGLESVGQWETRIELTRSWSLPQTERDFFSKWPAGLRDAWLDTGASPERFDEDQALECHRLWGCTAMGLDEPYFFEPPEGAPKDIGDYQMLLRLTFDNEADFAWGTNWVYVLVPREDAARGDLSRLLVTAANS